MAILIKSFSAKKIPWFDVADTIISFLFFIIILLLIKVKLKFSIIVKGISYSLCFVLIIIGLLFEVSFKTNFVIISVGLICNLLIYFATYNIWMLFASSAFNRSWLTLTIIGCGAQLGVYLGSSIGNISIDNDLVGYLPVFLGIIYFLIFFGISLCIQKFSCAGIREQHFIETKSTISQIKSIPRLPFKYSITPYIQSILLLLFLGTIYGRIVNWNIQQLADYKSTIKETSTFLATFYKSNAILSLLVQAIITPILLSKLNTKIGLLIQPTIGFLILLSLILQIETSWIAWLSLIYTSIDFTVYNSFKEKLWIYTSLNDKIKSKALSVLLIPKLTALLFSVIILVFANNNYNLFILILCLLIFGWVLTILICSRNYFKNEKLGVQVIKPSIDSIG
jgi:hypothetical protein